MMKSDYAVGVDQNITSQLTIVRPGLRDPSPLAEDQPQVFPDRARSIDGPCAASGDSILLIRGKVRVDQEWPGEARFFEIGLRDGATIKTDNDHVDLAISERCFKLTQLRQMFPARQSAKVAMKDDEQPVAMVVTQVVHLPTQY